MPFGSGALVKTVAAAVAGGALAATAAGAVVTAITATAAAAMTPPDRIAPSVTLHRASSRDA
jgi:hypothetical protein